MLSQEQNIATKVPHHVLLSFTHLPTVSKVNWFFQRSQPSAQVSSWHHWKSPSSGAQKSRSQPSVSPPSEPQSPRAVSVDDCNEEFPLVSTGPQVPMNIMTFYSADMPAVHIGVANNHKRLKWGRWTKGGKGTRFRFSKSRRWKGWSFVSEGLFKKP